MKRLLFLLITIFLLSNPAYSAIDFDGADDVLDGPDFGLDDEQTIFCQVYLRSWPSGTADYFYVAGSSLDWNSQIFINDEGLITYYVVQGAPTTAKPATASKLTVSGDEHIIIGRKLGAETSIWVDGVKLGTNSSGALRSTGQSHIGKRNDSTDFDGVFRRFALWSTGLSDEEIAQLTNSNIKHIEKQISPDSLVCSLNMDEHPDGTELDGIDLVDSSWSGNSFVASDGANNTGMTAVAESVLSYP